MVLAAKLFVKFGKEEEQMSRVGKLPVELPDSVTANFTEENADWINIEIKGPKGNIKKRFRKVIDINQEDKSLVVSRKSDRKLEKSLHGTYRALLSNMVKGVTEGFEKKLVSVGVGYRMQLKGKDLELNMGYSHPVLYKAPEGITFTVEGQTNLSVSGVDLESVGQVAAEIRAVRPPEPYKGKGIKYIDEQIIRKAGKSAK